MEPFLIAPLASVFTPKLLSILYLLLTGGSKKYVQHPHPGNTILVENQVERPQTHQWVREMCTPRMWILPALAWVNENSLFQRPWRRLMQALWSTDTLIRHVRHQDHPLHPRTSPIVRTLVLHWTSMTICMFLLWLGGKLLEGRDSLLLSSCPRYYLQCLLEHLELQHRLNSGLCISFPSLFSCQVQKGSLSGSLRVKADQCWGIHYVGEFGQFGMSSRV